MKKKWLCTLIKKYRADWSSQNPHCFTTMWKTYDLRRQTRVHRRARGTQQNLPNKRKHNINISRQKFLKESNTILPNCKPVDKLNPHEHGSCLGAAYPASRTWAAISTEMDTSAACHYTSVPPFTLKSAIFSLSMHWTANEAVRLLSTQLAASKNVV